MNFFQLLEDMQFNVLYAYLVLLDTVHYNTIIKENNVVFKLILSLMPLLHQYTERQQRLNAALQHINFKFYRNLCLNAISCNL